MQQPLPTADWDQTLGKRSLVDQSPKQLGITVPAGLGRGLISAHLLFCMRLYYVVFPVRGRSPDNISSPSSSLCWAKTSLSLHLPYMNDYCAHTRDTRARAGTGFLIWVRISSSNGLPEFRRSISRSLSIQVRLIGESPRVTMSTCATSSVTCLSLVYTVDSDSDIQTKKQGSLHDTACTPCPLPMHGPRYSIAYC